MISHAVALMPLTSHPDEAKNEHTGFSPDHAGGKWVESPVAFVLDS